MDDQWWPIFLVPVKPWLTFTWWMTWRMLDINLATCSPDSCFNQLRDKLAIMLWSVHQSAKCWQPGRCSVRRDLKLKKLGENDKKKTFMKELESTIQCIEVGCGFVVKDTHQIIFPHLSNKMKRLRTFFILSPRVLKFCMKLATHKQDRGAAILAHK